MRRKIFLSNSREAISVDIEHILAFSTTADRRINMKYTDDGKVKDFEFKCTLDRLQKLLPDKEFLRVHKGFLVSAYHIRKIDHDGITLDVGAVKVPVGRNYNCFRNQMEQGYVEIITLGQE